MVLVGGAFSSNLLARLVECSILEHKEKQSEIALYASIHMDHKVENSDQFNKIMKHLKVTKKPLLILNESREAPAAFKRKLLNFFTPKNFRFNQVVAACTRGPRQDLALEYIGIGTKYNLFQKPVMVQQIDVRFYHEYLRFVTCLFDEKMDVAEFKKLMSVVYKDELIPYGSVEILQNSTLTTLFQVLTTSFEKFKSLEKELADKNLFFNLTVDGLKLSYTQALEAFFKKEKKRIFSLIPLEDQKKFIGDLSKEVKAKAAKEICYLYDCIFDIGLRLVDLTALSTILSTTEKNIAVFAGQLHTDILKDVLLAIGYTVKKEFSCLDDQGNKVDSNFRPFEKIAPVDPESFSFLIA